MGTVLLVLIDLACLLASGTARENAAWEPGLEARVDAIERNFEAELQQAEDRMRSELEQMKGELERMGGRLDRCEAGSAALGHEMVVTVIERDSGQPRVEPADFDVGDLGARAQLQREEGQLQTNEATKASVLTTTEENTAQRQCEQRVAVIEAKVSSIEAELQTQDVAGMVKNETASFADTHRRLQQEEQCRGAGMQTMLLTCCPAGGGIDGGHRRQLQGGCSGFPATCSAECAELFVQYYEGCQSIIVAMHAGSGEGRVGWLLQHVRGGRRGDG